MEALGAFLEREGGQLPFSKQMQDLVTRLPKITETELKDVGHSESVCPVCFNTFLAILAEEEMALAMDSPAHPVEELGVTRLHETCGHLFCRRDITKWMRDGRESCPTCRRPFLTVDDQRVAEQYAPPGDFLPPWSVESSMDIMAAMSGNPSTHRRQGRDQFTGMYS